jgi:hypothetical protein
MCRARHCHLRRLLNLRHIELLCRHKYQSLFRSLVLCRAKLRPPIIQLKKLTGYVQLLA